MKNFQTVLAVILLLVTSILIPAKTVFADDNQVNITVNKRIWEQGAAPENIQNTGDTMDFGGDPLNGSEFTIYDVTDKYYNLIKGSDPKLVIEQMQKDAEAVAPDYATKVSAQVTAGAGQATFADLPIKDANGKYSIYLLVETKTPTNITVTKRSVPLVLTMPMYKVDNNQKLTDVINTNIQVYPKNETAKDIKSFTNSGEFSEITLNGKTFSNVTTGDTLNYSLAVNIPANIGDATAVTSFKIHDKPSDGLALVDDTVKVGDLTLDTDYQITYAAGGFSVELLLTSPKVKALAGKKLQLTYHMKLTDEVKPDELQNNKASVQINNMPEQEITPPIPVGTGGYQFIKKDARTDKVLKGAEFIVVNEAGTKFAKFKANKNGNYIFTEWASSKDDATKVISDENGAIAIIGLTNGTYGLNETKAPSEQYVVLKDGTITFEVIHGTYGSAILSVKNTPKGLLPSTGGAGIYAFLIIGTTMMVGAYIWSKKTKQITEV